MSTEYPWLTGWRTDAPVRLTTGFLPRDSWESASGIRTHLEFWDSGLAASTDGKLGVQRVRYVAAEGTDSDHGWHFHDLDWQFFYVLAGTVRQETESDGALILGAGDSGCYPGFMWHRESHFSQGCEMLAMRSPSRTVTTTGRDAPFPARASSVDPQRGPIYSLRREARYVPGEGGERGFEIRDLGSSEATQGRIGVREIRASRADLETPLRQQDASKWLVGLTGSARIEVKPAIALTLGRLDALTIAPGPTATHRLVSCSADFSALELSLPAASATDAASHRAPHGR